MKSKINFNWKSPTLFIGIITLFILCSCGSDGDGSNSNTSEITGTISGSVGGTTIIALDDEGLIISSDNTKRRIPDLDLDGDGIEESYSFTIVEVPVDKNIRIYLVESRGVSPLYFDNNGTDINVFSLSSSAEIDLGFLDSNGGIAIPEYNPAHDPNINPEGVDKEMKPISQVVSSDFVGTWQGDVFYIVGTGVEKETGTADITITLSESQGSLVGTFHFYEKTYEGTEERIEDWTVNVAGTVSLSGALSFPLPKPSDLENNPDCNTWNISLTAILPEPSTMDIDFDGSVCSGRYGNFSDFIYKQ